ncbi:hypothetical protein [Sphingobacterium bovistauri]|uniref:Lipoprotein n=1 Tax=Sphingobacterium bovistauri TaxID=2781959 RepID=A0ABS7Z8F1_9SPHI|nr:hypothetical protein [Sphingobacterium bovistauri]MCA5005229.1 hypothetical protein [Sphingobacterium bovistauri]
MKKIYTLSILLLLLTVNSCKSTNHVSDVAAFSYMPYATMSIVCDGIDYGMGAGGVSTDVTLNPGKYWVTWADAGTGKVYKSKNQILIPENITSDFTILHVYQDDTVEIEFSNNWPSPKADKKKQ